MDKVFYTQKIQEHHEEFDPTFNCPHCEWEADGPTADGGGCGREVSGVVLPFGKQQLGGVGQRPEGVVCRGTEGGAGPQVEGGGHKLGGSGGGGEGLWVLSLPGGGGGEA